MNELDKEVTEYLFIDTLKIICSYMYQQGKKIRSEITKNVCISAIV